MRIEVVIKGKKTFRNVIRFKVINGPLAGKVIERRAPLRSHTSFPKQLVPRNPTPFRLGKKIGEDFYEIEQTQLC